MPVIGISGSYGGLNLGDEAILTSMVTALRRRRPDAELVVFSRRADHTLEHHAVDRVVAARDVSRDDVRPEVERCDLFLLGGGGILYDEEARLYLRDVRLAQERSIPTFAYAVGAGPLNEREDRRAVREVLQGMNGVTVRDQVSKRTLEDVGVDRAVTVTADPALTLTPEPFTEEMLRAEGIEREGVLVGMSVREPGRAATHLDVDRYHQLLAHAADFIVHRFSAEVVFVAMERDDIRHSHAVVSHMQAADRAHVLKRRYRPRQLLGLMDHLDLVVGMRLHFLMFAAVAEVPFLPLPYARKVFDFVEAMSLPVPVEVQGSWAGPLLAALDRLWDTRRDRRDHLCREIAPLQARARHTPELALALLGPREQAKAS